MYILKYTLGYINNEAGLEKEDDSYTYFGDSIDVAFKALGKKAACILTISDSLVTHQETTAEERQNAFTAMMKIALEAAE